MYEDDRGFERAMNLFSNFNQIFIALSEEWLFLPFKVVKKLRETFVLMFIVKD